MAEHVGSNMQQVGAAKRAGALCVALAQGIDQRAVLLLVFEPAFGGGASALQQPPLALRARLAHQAQHAGDGAVVRRRGNGLVQRGVPLLEGRRARVKAGLTAAAPAGSQVAARWLAVAAAQAAWPDKPITPITMITMITMMRNNLSKNFPSGRVYGN